MTWHEAKVACEKEEGKLASVHNPGENTFIALKLKKADIAQGWIGLHDLNEENTFEWVDSSPADFFHWGPSGMAKVLNFNFSQYQNIRGIFKSLNSLVLLVKIQQLFLLTQQVFYYHLSPDQTKRMGKVLELAGKENLCFRHSS